MLSYTADERWSKRAARTTHRSYQDKHPFFSYFRFFICFLPSSFFLFFGILFWGYSAPTLHTGDASIYPHNVVIFHALRPNNKNPIHEQQAFFSARSIFVLGNLKKSRYCRLLKQETGTSRRGCGNWTEMERVQFWYHTTISRQSAAGSYTHTHTQRIRFLAMSISSMGKDHGGDFLFSLSNTNKVVGFRRWWRATRFVCAELYRRSSPTRKRRVVLAGLHSRCANQDPLFISFLVRLSTRIDRSPSRDSTTDTLVLVNSTEAHHFLMFMMIIIIRWSLPVISWLLCRLTSRAHAFIRYASISGWTFFQFEMISGALLCVCRDWKSGNQNIIIARSIMLSGS